MESGIGIQSEDGSIVVDKTIVGDPLLGAMKEEGEEVLGGNEDSENATNSEEGLGLFEGKVESSGTVLESKLSNPGKVTGANSKNSKTSVRPTYNKATKVACKEKRSLTQGRSFPAKGLCANTQSSAKHSGESRSIGKAPVSNGTGNLVSRRTSTGASTSGESNSAASASIRQSTLVSLPSMHQSVMKPVSTNGTTTCLLTDGFLSIDQPTKSDKTLSSTEQDAHSPNSSYSLSLIKI